MKNSIPFTPAPFRVISFISYDGGMVKIDNAYLPSLSEDTEVDRGSVTMERINWIMILLLDGNSENGAQMWSTLGHYIDWIKAMLSTSKKLNFLLAPYHPTERSKHIQNIIKYIRHIIRTHFNLIIWSVLQRVKVNVLHIFRNLE